MRICSQIPRCVLKMNLRDCCSKHWNMQHNSISFFSLKKKRKSNLIRCKYILQNHCALNREFALLENQIFNFSPWSGRIRSSPPLLLFSYFTWCLLISETLSPVAFSGEWMLWCSNAAWCLDQSLSQIKYLHMTSMRLLIYEAPDLGTILILVLLSFCHWERERIIRNDSQESGKKTHHKVFCKAQHLF